MALWHWPRISFLRSFVRILPKYKFRLLLSVPSYRSLKMYGMPFLLWMTFLPDLGISFSSVGFMYEDPLSLERVMECEESGSARIEQVVLKKKLLFPQSRFEQGECVIIVLFVIVIHFFCFCDRPTECREMVVSTLSFFVFFSLVLLYLSPALEFTMSWADDDDKNPSKVKRKNGKTMLFTIHEWSLSQRRSNSSIMFTKWTLTLDATLSGIFFVVISDFSFLGIITDFTSFLPPASRRWNLSLSWSNTLIIIIIISISETDSLASIVDPKGPAHASSKRGTFFTNNSHCPGQLSYLLVHCIMMISSQLLTWS